MASPFPSGEARLGIGEAVDEAPEWFRRHFKACVNDPLFNVSDTKFPSWMVDTVARYGLPTPVGSIVGANFAIPKRYYKPTVKDIVSSTDETDMFNNEITVGAGVMGVNRSLRATLAGDFLNDTGVNRAVTVRVKFGGTTLFDDATVAFGTSASRRPWRIDILMPNLDGPVSQYLTGSLRVGQDGIATTGIGDLASTSDNSYTFATAAAFAIDTTAAQAFQVTAQLPASSASLSWRVFYGIVEII